MSAYYTLVKGITLLCSSLLILVCALAQPTDPLVIRAQQYTVQRVSESEFAIELQGQAVVAFRGRELRGERFLLDTAARRVRAEAPFSLLAEEGSLSGQRLDYFYERGRGQFEGVQGNLYGIYLDAVRLEGDLTDFTAYETIVSTCDPVRPPIRLQARSVRLRDGARLTLRNARFFLYGQPLLTLPQLTVRIRETTELVSLPAPVYTAETGWGVRLRTELPLGESTLLQASGVSYLRAIPELRFMLGVALGAGEPALSEPDLRLRFEQSAMYNLRAAPERMPPTLAPTLRLEYSTDIRPLLAPRERMRLSRREVSIVQPLQYREGYGDMNLRYGELNERIDNLRSPTRNRLALDIEWFQQIAQRDNWSLRTHWWASYAYYQGGFEYQWLRPQLELLYQTRESLTLMLGYARASSRGASPFLLDRLQAKRELILRAEYKQGNLRLGALFKYDIETRELYDVQLLLGWRDRCLEPYLFWRRTPSAILLGVNLTTIGF
ncbi:MAG: hypothetical protein KatS3mg019_0477 [Fimbriimonadales bacterium]|nr:MAG: hypothetical protein KatS3mg019_0477 [Fimbriimonadales bacterium]